MAGSRNSLDLSSARALQEELARRVRTEWRGRRLRRVAGLDASYWGEMGIGAAVVMSWPALEVLEERWVVQEVSFPYIPGYLSFREVPLLEDALRGVRQPPDLLFVDGQGIAHPRGIGLASHLGVLLGMPTIGCAKEPLVGSGEEPEDRRGAISPLRYRERVVGVALRTKLGVKPIYVSPGHLIDLERSWRVVLEATRGYRLPEPVRRAHLLAQRVRRLLEAAGRPPGLCPPR